jgi:predicted phosphoribosyltransferase
VKAAHPFANRVAAGQQLAHALIRYAHRPDAVVLALPRGGVPVAFEVARTLGCPLDVLVVRKLGVPGQEEFAMGAIASGGVCELNRESISELGLTPAQVEAVRRREMRELERRERAYRGGRPPLDVRGRTVILVDDGLATGTTMLAAASAVRALGARRVVAAIPVGASESCRRLQPEVDELVCLLQPSDLIAVSVWYEEFAQTSDEEVRALLAQAHPAHAGG